MFARKYMYEKLTKCPNLQSSWINILQYFSRFIFLGGLGCNWPPPSPTPMVVRENESYTGNMVVSELDIKEIDSRLVRLILESILGGWSTLHLQVWTMCAFHRDTHSAKSCTSNTRNAQKIRINTRYSNQSWTWVNFLDPTHTNSDPTPTRPDPHVGADEWPVTRPDSAQGQ